MSFSVADASRVRQQDEGPADAELRVGECLVEPELNRISGPAGEFLVEPKSMAVLEYLVAVPGRVVSAEELIQVVWRGRPMGDSPVYRCISQLRRALGDDPRQPRYIATVPTKGYRLVAPVGVGAGTPAETGAGAVSTPPRWLAPGLGVGALAMLLAVAGWRIANQPPAPGPSEHGAFPTIAVLPLEPRPDTEENAYLADGLSHEILNRLSRHQNLRVVARTSSFSFRGAEHEPRRVADALGADYLVVGQVERQGDTLRVNASLVGRDGFEAWSGTFVHEGHGHLLLQSQLALAIAGHLGSPSPDAVPERSFEVMQHYLLAREQLARRPPGFAAAARDQLDRAIALDPDFADAWAQRAIARLFLGFSEVEGKGHWDAAAADIQRALALDPESALAHAADGFRLSMLGHERRGEAEAALRRALALDPHQVNTWNWLSGVLRSDGREDEADRALQRAAQIDPLAPTIGANLAGSEARRGAFDAAEDRLLRLRLAPRPGHMVHVSLINLYLETGRFTEALQAAQQAVLQDFPASAARMEEVALVYTRLGDWRRADEWVSRRRASLPPHPTFDLHVATGALHRSPPALQSAWHAFEALRLEHQLSLHDLTVHLQLKSGILAALAGEHAAARAILEPLIDERLALQGMESGEEPNARQALAWSWLYTGESNRALSLLARLDGWFRQEHAAGRLHLASERYQWARNLALQDRGEEALATLESAEQAGWRGLYEMQADPRWDALRASPRFVLVSERIEQALAEERARIDALDPNGEFAARIDTLSQGHARVGPGE